MKQPFAKQPFAIDEKYIVLASNPDILIGMLWALAPMVSTFASACWVQTSTLLNGLRPDEIARANDMLRIGGGKSPLGYHLRNIGRLVLYTVAGVLLEIATFVLGMVDYDA